MWRHPGLGLGSQAEDTGGHRCWGSKSSLVHHPLLARKHALEALTGLELGFWGSPGCIFRSTATTSTWLAPTFHAVGDGCRLLQVLG